MNKNVALVQNAQVTKSLRNKALVDLMTHLTAMALPWVCSLHSWHPAETGIREPRSPIRCSCVRVSEPQHNFMSTSMVLAKSFSIHCKLSCKNWSVIDGSLGEKSVRTYKCLQRERERAQEGESVCLSLPCHQRMTHVIRGGTWATDICLTLPTRHGRCGDRRVVGRSGKPCGPRVHEGGWNRSPCLLAHRCGLLGEGAINVLLLKG